MEILRFETNYFTQQRNVIVLLHSHPAFTREQAMTEVQHQALLNHDVGQIIRRYYDVLENGQYVAYLVAVMFLE